GPTAVPAGTDVDVGARSGEAGVKPRIRLRGVNGDVEGKVWEADAVLRAGRLGSLEIVLDDSSVSRRHAELRLTEQGWQLRDLGSTNGTFLNGARVSGGDRPVKLKDVIQFGKVALVVDEMGNGAEPAEPTTPPPGANDLMVEAASSASWEDALQGLAF